MDHVILTADGILTRNARPVESNVLGCLNRRVALADDVTLRSFFRMMERYPALRELNEFYPAYLEQYRKSPESGCTYHGFDQLELGKTVEMIGFPGKPRLEIYHSFHGASGDECLEIRSIALENLLDMPVRLGRLKHIVFGDHVDVLEFDTVFNLFDVIDGILWELSFQGTLVCGLRR